MKINILFLCLYIALMGCNGNGVNGKLHHASEKAGEAVSEIAKGVSQGVEKSFEIQIEKADSNALRGIELGKIELKSKEGTDNMLSVYFVFKKDFSKKIMIRVYDSKGLEMGRCSQLVKGKKDEAGFTDFIFDKRTNIDRDSKIVME
jgi:hypothetical protein